MSKRARYGLQGLVLIHTVPVMVLITVVAGIVIYGQLYRAILDGFDGKLIAVASITAQFVDGDSHAPMVAETAVEGFDAEAMSARADYLAAVEPMRRIKTGLDLTYLYTQSLTGDLGIVYLFDANTDDNHSPPGYADTLPEDDADNIKRVISDRILHLTPIQAWEQWGLIKTAFAPVIDSRGQAVAMAGADVDITSIQSKTRIALVNVGIAGALALIVGVSVAVAISVRLAAPIRRIKYAGFEVAAGKYGSGVEPSGPTELRRLAAGFNRMSEALDRRLADMHESGRRTEERLREQGLVRLLAERIGAGDTVAFARAQETATAVSGAVRDGGLVLWWFAVPGDTPLQAAVARGAWAECLGRLLRAEGAGAIALADNLLGGGLCGLALYDADSGRLTLRTDLPLLVTLLAPGRPAESRTVTGAAILAVPAGTTGTIAAADATDPDRPDHFTARLLSNGDAAADATETVA